VNLDQNLVIIARDTPSNGALYAQLLQQYRATAATSSNIDKLNKALDDLVAANKAIATAKPEDTAAAVQTFIEDATAAYNFYKSLPTK
jgi:hypothetical protein